MTTRRAPALRGASPIDAESVAGPRRTRGCPTIRDGLALTGLRRSRRPIVAEAGREAPMRAPPRKTARRRDVPRRCVLH